MKTRSEGEIPGLLSGHGANFPEYVCPVGRRSEIQNTVQEYQGGLQDSDVSGRRQHDSDDERFWETV